jgi:hypothetical protein
MTILNRLKTRTGEMDETLLSDCLDSARNAILARRFPYHEWPDEVPPQYSDLQFRIAMDLYNKIGAEGQTAHSENGVSRTFESSWISDQLLREVTPLVGVPK